MYLQGKLEQIMGEHSWKIVESAKPICGKDLVIAENFFAQDTIFSVLFSKLLYVCNTK